MLKKLRNKKKVEFLLENTHYRKLNLYIYLTSVFLIVLIYFLSILFFSKNNLVLTSIISISIGLYLVFNKNKLIKFINSKLQDNKLKENKLKENKIRNKKGLTSTIRKIIPKSKSNISLKIKDRLSVKEKFKKLKNKLINPKKKENTKYIEIK